jgi:hypothetical protein
MFSNSPFSHTGIKTDFKLSTETSLLLGVFNQTGVTEFYPDESYALTARLCYSNPFLNLLYEKARSGFEVDYTGGFDATNTFFLGINAAYAANDAEGFYGVALYPQYKTADTFTLGLRREYFATQSKATSDDPTIFAVALTASHTVVN